MSSVFVLDTEHRPMNPVHAGDARRLLTSGRAAVWRRYPFTIILKSALPDAKPQPLRIKIDPGSKTTGLALVNDTTGQVVWAGELMHRGQRVRDALLSRHALRRGRRQRNTRYRPARFQNRRRPQGWLPPSLQSRIANVLTWVSRLSRCGPVAALSLELVKFDTQLIQSPDISGFEYQQGTLAGYEVREYLLEKWRRQCSYCGATNVPLQIEHVIPKTRGGSNRISNLALACEPCNRAKGTQTAIEFGHPAVQAQAQMPLKDAIAVNASRWALFHLLMATDLPVEVGTGGRTKWNRTVRGLPKAHWIDAVCVGASTPDTIHVASVSLVRITATGHGTRQMCGTNRFGFPIRHRTCQKRFFGFQTGDMVRVTVPEGLKTAGAYIGRVLVRARGSFDVTTASGRVQGVSYHYCRAISRSDGYAYAC